MITKFSLPPELFVRYGERHTDGKIYGGGCISLAYQQVAQGIPVGIEWSSREIGRAFPAATIAGIKLGFEISDPKALISRMHPHFDFDWKLGVRVDEWEWQDDRQVITSAMIFSVSLVPRSVALPQMRVVGA